MCRLCLAHEAPLRGEDWGLAARRVTVGTTRRDAVAVVALANPAVQCQPSGFCGQRMIFIDTCGRGIVLATEISEETLKSVELLR